MLDWLGGFVKERMIAIGLKEFADPISAFSVGLAQLLLIILLVWLTLRFGGTVIDQVFRQRLGTSFLDEKRAATLATLLKSVLFYSVFFIAGMVVLETVFTVDTKALLAGAGVLGLAVGFGAQSLVRDVITGFFIIFENQYAVGDYVTIGKFSGVVEEMGLRVTKIRDLTGELHIIPNGEIKEVSNKSRGPIVALVDVSVAYEENIDKALDILRDASRELAEKMADVITEGPNVLGVTNLGPSEVVIRVSAKTVPMEQWKVEREMRRYFKTALDQAGIEIPYPRRVFVPFASGKSPVNEQLQRGRALGGVELGTGD